MSSSIWDDPEIATAGEYIKFDAVGDSVSGEVIAVQIHRFDDGKAVPKLILATDDGEEKALTAGQVRLKAALNEQRPEPGDHITVTFTEEEKRPGGKTLKHFDVEVARAGSNGKAKAAPKAEGKAEITAEQLAALESLKAQGLI